MPSSRPSIFAARAASAAAASLCRRGRSLAGDGTTAGGRASDVLRRSTAAATAVRARTTTPPSSDDRSFSSSRSFGGFAPPPRRRFSSARPPARPKPSRIDVVEKDDPDAEEDDDPDRPPNPQDFVKVRLEPGEWDPDTGRTDPTHRPPWKSNAKIISAEDFRERPRAGFHEEFESIHDAMVTLSWLTAADRDKIYQLYLDMMSAMSKSDRGVTSHEYVTKVVGQKFNVSARRVAAVVQNQHDEQQMKKNNPDMIHREVQAYVDAKIKEHIRNAYREYGEQEPGDMFVEDPLGGRENVGGWKDTELLVTVDDEIDVDELLKDAIVREEEDARVAIDGKIYAEDEDLTTVESKVDDETRKLMREANAWGGAKGKKLRRPESIRPPPLTDDRWGGESGNEDGEGEGGTETKESRRPRWKFVAKTINTYELKKKRGGGRRGPANADHPNTLVEQDGTVRVATIDEIANTSWKPERNVAEFTYRGAKQAWLDRTLRGEVGGWGRVESEEKEEVAAANEDDSDGDDGDGSSSSSSDEESGDENAEEEKEEEEEESKTEEDEKSKKD